jgi:hypothetical protein
LERGFWGEAVRRRALAASGTTSYYVFMSFAEIIEEVPKLSAHERRELFLQVLSLEPENEDLAVCDHIAAEGFAILEAMEAELKPL